MATAARLGVLLLGCLALLQPAGESHDLGAAAHSRAEREPHCFLTGGTGCASSLPMALLPQVPGT